MPNTSRTYSEFVFPGSERLTENGLEVTVIISYEDGGFISEEIDNRILLYFFDSPDHYPRFKRIVSSEGRVSNRPLEPFLRYL